jgi:hypothetical protein
MANDMLRLWEAIEPMAKASVERQTRDSVRMKQMVITVAYNSATKTVGVAEPFSNTIQIPVYGGIDPTSLTVGTAVWVMCPYSSMSNAMVFMAGDGSLPGGGASGLEARVSALESAVNGMWETIYPVGSLYISVSSTSPQTLFGGTWVQIEDTFLLAAGQTYTAGDTGGNATHTHTTASHTLTVAEMPQHYHTFVDYWNTYGSGSSKRNAPAVNGDSTGIPSSERNNRGRTTGVIQGTTNMAERSGTDIGQGHSHGDTGSASSLPPYLAVYVWKRTA